VLVVGGGNSAVEEALYLTNHASKVTLIHRKDSLRAEKILQERLFKHPKIRIIWNHILEEVVGTEEPLSVTGARLKDVNTQEIQHINADGIFIAIGHTPNTSLFRGAIDTDSDGYIITAPRSTATNIKGVFAAGDVQDKIYRQAVTAAGSGCMAALEAEKLLASEE
jgi:thioredoxin reductase (NADPH)